MSCALEPSISKKERREVCYTTNLKTGPSGKEAAARERAAVHACRGLRISRVSPAPFGGLHSVVSCCTLMMDIWSRLCPSFPSITGRGTRSHNVDRALAGFLWLFMAGRPRSGPAWQNGRLAICGNGSFPGRLFRVDDHAWDCIFHYLTARCGASPAKDTAIAFW